MYTDYCGVLLLYTNYCGVLFMYTRWSLYICTVIHTIMGPSYVCQLLWGLTLVHKMVQKTNSFILLYR